MPAETATPLLTSPITGIVTAARACFDRYGVQRTRMEDVAHRAGISRQALYAHVAGRNDLIRLVVLARLVEIQSDLRAIAVAATEFDAGLTEWMLAALDVGANDPELTNIVDTGAGLGINELYVGEDPDIHEGVATCIQPLLALGREQRRIRKDLDDDAVVDWIRGVLLSLIHSRHLDDSGRRAVVRNFVLPSLA